MRTFLLSRLCKNMFFYECIPSTSKYALKCKIKFCTRESYCEYCESSAHLTPAAVHKSVKTTFLHRNPRSEKNENYGRGGKHFCRTSRRCIYRMHETPPTRGGRRTETRAAGFLYCDIDPFLLIFFPFTDPPNPPHPVFVCSSAVTGFLSTTSPPQHCTQLARVLYTPLVRRALHARLLLPLPAQHPRAHTQPFVPTGKSRTILPFASAISACCGVWYTRTTFRLRRAERQLILLRLLDLSFLQWREGVQYIIYSVFQNDSSDFSRLHILYLQLFVVNETSER